jgi:hypothetical protein
LASPESLQEIETTIAIIQENTGMLEVGYVSIPDAYIFNHTNKGPINIYVILFRLLSKIVYL